MTDIPPPFDQAWFLGILGFIIGVAFGSFVTMLSYRLPRGMSIVLPPSACPTCHSRLTARDLVPILSFLFSRAKCRHCGAPIGARYVLIELMTGITCAAAFALIGFKPALIAAVTGVTALIAFLTIKLEGKKN